MNGLLAAWSQGTAQIVVLYKMVSGEHPLAGGRGDAVADRIVRQ